jgi:hypothetical protein
MPLLCHAPASGTATVNHICCNTLLLPLLLPLLQYLRAIGCSAAPFGQQVVFYLAAAVSDFYVPWSQLVS